jgi:hypothetical protein
MAKYRWLAPLLFLPLVQCQDGSITGPGTTDEIPATAIRLRVDVAAGTVTQVNVPASGDLRFSLVGSDAVSLQTSNFTETALGKNKITVRFDVAITNSLTNVTLIHPTVTPAPAGTTGLLLFPVQATPTAGSGSITASNDWDGAPFNFLNDGSCKGSGSNCYRWEEFAAPLPAGTTSAAQNVGFEMDKSITSFDVVMLLAADLQNVAAAPAAISLSQTTANFEWASGTASPTSVSVVVANSGGGSLNGLTAVVTYQAGQPAGWLAANLSSTTAPSTLSLAAFISPSMGDGTYNATVDVVSAGVSNSPQTVTVTFVVSGAWVSTAIYVSESDPAALNDGTCGLGPVGSGTGNHPCQSIGQGLARAVATGRSEIRVADGRYSEAVTLVNGKHLLGGYHPDTWLRHLSTTNTIIDGVSPAGNHDRTVIANSITSPTVFEGFVVRGASNSKTGGNSYAIYVSSSNANLVIRNNSIYGGVGGPGMHGASGVPGSQGANGTGRDSNPGAYDSKIATGTGQCDASNNRSYTNGGVGSVGVDVVSGGNGGGNVCPPSSTFQQQSAQNGVLGFAGEGAAGGSAGTAGAGGVDFKLQSGLCYIAPSGSQSGTNGGPGGNGQHGGAVLGATDAVGSVSASHWMGASGTSGVGGGNGGGGGGGGAGGGAYAVALADGKDRLGGGGGGGGAGGAGGGGGGAGTAGGGAFGIFIIGVAPVVTGNTIVLGNGGTGGSGGGGAAGSFGGQGGAGGLAMEFCTAEGGRGGNGGQGGTGSGGGGGSGGASFGIFTSGAGTPSYCTSDNNVISGGAGGSGGQGGASPVNPGGSGASGAVATCSFN